MKEITTLLALSITAQTTTSRKVRQAAKMKAGKVRKVLSEANKDRSVKIEN